MKLLKLQRLKESSARLKKARWVIKKFFPAVLIAGIFIALAVFLTTLSGTKSVVNLILNVSGLKSTNGRVNVLLLGIAGGTHDGADLTDTIMVASYDLKTNRVSLISIPRDLWIPSFKSKANAVYEIGAKEGDRLGFSKTVMGNILGLPMHYLLRVDFGGFIKAVDQVGGVDVDIDQSFDDYNYPIAGKETDMCGNEEKEVDFSEDEAKKLNIEPGKRRVLITVEGKTATDSADPIKGARYFSCRFEQLSFKAGPVHLDGEAALKYVRSRHGTNGEGSDFARSKRQQKVLEAFRSKVLSAETLFNPSRLPSLINTFGKSIDTDISIKEAVELYKLSKKITKTQTFVLDDSVKKDLPYGRTSLLVNPPASDYGGAYVLVSEDDDFSFIQQYIRQKLTKEAANDEATASARRGD